KLINQIRQLMTEDLEPYVKANEKLFSAIPALQYSDPDMQLLYWTSFAMMRQVMLPPEGKSSYNYYVFSREPQWGWGHGGQVFHESLTMLAYALMDKTSAMNSQRVYRERQLPDGYINYRTGAFLDETIPEHNQLTTSAPWYAWQNWEVYNITKDKQFLEEMYESSKKFYNYYVKNRDSDGDGLCEWGGEAVLESVRDARVAVWDEVGYPSNFEAVDLNSMLVQEEKSLSAMALELGRNSEAREWTRKAEERSKKINEIMWDDSTGFYYNVDKKTHTFTFKKPNDLKRQEIIGFLPMWAGIADKQRAERLVEKLTDPKKFWRKYGVPSLSADDPYYNPKGYWNGPVWVEWNYLIMRGLLDYGYPQEAKELVMRVAANMIAELKKNHNLWEFYSPDDQWAGYHKTYIWAGMISRMLLDVQGIK
ncbi:MAG: trehalase family glycosidase, partial [Bacteroidota bacterium]